MSNMSNKKCCVPGCANKTGAKETLHKFPNPDIQEELPRFRNWVYSIGGDILSLTNNHIFKYRRVCQLHFEQKYWCRNNRLCNVAVPTLSMPGLSPLKFSTIQSASSRQAHSEETTSKGPVPVSLSSKPAATQRFPLSAMENVPPQENIGPVPVASSSKPAGTQKLPLSAVENVPPQENIGPVPVASSSKLADTQKLPLSAVENIAPQENIVCCRSSFVPKRRLKGVRLTSDEHALYKKLKRVGVKLSKCRSTIKLQKAKIKVLQNITKNPQFLTTLDSMPNTAKILTLLQFRERKKEHKGRRFSMKEKIVALSILKQSPKAYRFLRKIFILPSRQTLIKLIHMADINPGVNKNTVEQIKAATQNMKIEDKLCVVLFDEMYLKANVTYNERKDRVCGFVTNGKETKQEYANHAQVFMVRGLLRNYKQPFAFTFSKGATKGYELAKQLKEVITHLQDAGLIVVATVCDQGRNNSSCIKYLLDETRGILLRKGEEPRGNSIIINDQEIIPLYDPPHLIKCIRNNLLTKDLQYAKGNEIKTAKWLHITQLFNENPGYKGIRLVPKLTSYHCDPRKIPKMKVKYATQLFSQTVASNMGYLADKGVLPEEAKDTADILLFFDKLFDSVNGSYGKKKKFGKPLLGPVTPSSVHHEQWREAKSILSTMKYIIRESGEPESVPTIKNWIWTLEGIEKLLRTLKSHYGVTSVWLRHLNQDPIENFFGSIRSHGCRNIEPTPDKFESAFTSLLINNLSSVHAPGANCEEDGAKALHEVLLSGEIQKTSLMLDNIPDITITPLEDKNDPRIIAGLQYVSGYFVKGAKKKIFKGCDQCKKDVINDNEYEYIKYREFANKKWLYNPSDSLLRSISSMQDINYDILKSNLEKTNLKELMKTMILVHSDFDFLNCKLHNEKLIEFLINTSCRFFIHNYCKDINNILSKKLDYNEHDDIFKVKAKKQANKCNKRK